MTTVPIRPMLAVLASGPIAFPPQGLFVQPKFDGVRCLIDPDTGPRLRGGGAIPNPHLRATLEDHRLAGLDGEITAPGGLQPAQSMVSGHLPLPEGWRFTAFDDVCAFSSGFSHRLQALRRRADRLPDYARISPTLPVARLDDLPDAVAALVAESASSTVALDGVCMRHPDRPYREGKAAAFRQELLKLKPMDEGERTVLDVAARADDPDCLGALEVSDQGRRFWAPAAMPRAEGRRLWGARTDLIGSQATLRWWGRTTGGALRHATALAFRRDLAA